MRRRMQTGRHNSPCGWYWLDARIIWSQYPRVVPIGRHRRKLGTHNKRIIDWSLTDCSIVYRDVVAIEWSHHRASLIISFLLIYQLDAVYQSGPLAPWYAGIVVEAFRFVCPLYVVHYLFAQRSTGLLYGHEMAMHLTHNASSSFTLYMYCIKAV